MAELSKLARRALAKQPAAGPHPDAGLLTAFAGTQLRPVFDAAAELRAHTGLPLLGVISLVVGDDERRRERRDLVRFLAGSVGLIIVFAGGLIATAFMASRQMG